MRSEAEEGEDPARQDEQDFGDPHDRDDRDDDNLIDGVGFANAGSALRAETENNPRNLPCPTCGAEDVLTPLDRARGYQCDRCADAAEGRY